MNLLELFSGSGNVSRGFRDCGFDTYSVDIRRRKGVCQPDLKADILDLTTHDLPPNNHVVWASPPCDIWSYAQAGFHRGRDGMLKTKKALEHLHILERTLTLIDELRPAYFFIENPRGHLRHYPRMLQWLEGRGTIKTVTLISYGFPTTKPTNIFTNAADWEPRPLAPFGRGAKVSGAFDNLTRCQRQATPYALAREIAEYCKARLSST